MTKHKHKSHLIIYGTCIYRIQYICNVSLRTVRAAKVLFEFRSPTLHAHPADGTPWASAWASWGARFFCHAFFLLEKDIKTKWEILNGGRTHGCLRFKSLESHSGVKILNGIAGKQHPAPNELCMESQQQCRESSNFP